MLADRNCDRPPQQSAATLYGHNHLVMAPFSLDQLTLEIPNLWDKPWANYIKEADGLEREFIVLLASCARILGRLSATPVTSEKLGWLSLWSRLFGTLSGVANAVNRESRFAASVMGRVMFEASLHLQAVMLPALEAGTVSENHWSEVRDRLRGYVAWSLYGDQRVYSKLAEEHTLDTIFDPRPDRDLVAELGSQLEAYQRLWGQELEVVSDQEASFDRDVASRKLAQRSHRIATWLTDPGLKPWAEQLAERTAAKGGQGTVTLFELFGLRSSIYEFLKRRDLAFAYWEYVKGSGFIHGHSLESSLWIDGGLVAPDFADLGEGLDTAARAVLAAGRVCVILLELVLAHVDVSDAPV